MQTHCILIDRAPEFNLAERHLAQIQEAAPGFEIVIKPRRELTPSDVAAAEIIFGRPKPEWVAAAPGVKWVQLPSAGAEDWVKIRPDDLLLTKASGTFGIPIAEWVIGAMLMLARNMHLYRDQQQEHRWQVQWNAREVMGSTVGILGLGDIGQQVARRAKALGCRVVGFRRHNQPVPFVDAILPLEQVLAESDFLVMALPATAETKGLMDARRMAQMKQGAYLINVGRGASVDEAALIGAIRSGHLAGAALDVTQQEPLPADSPLWEVPEVIIAPHASSISLEKNCDRRTEIFCENLRRYLTGQPLINLVDRRAGY